MKPVARLAYSKESVLGVLPTFSLVNALVYVRHRPGHSLGKKSDDEVQHSPLSWLDDFTQRFSWRRPSARALLFLNSHFLPGVYDNGSR